MPPDLVVYTAAKFLRRTIPLTGFSQPCHNLLFSPGLCFLLETSPPHRQSSRRHLSRALFLGLESARKYQGALEHGGVLIDPMKKRCSLDRFRFIATSCGDFAQDDRVPAAQQIKAVPPGARLSKSRKLSRRTDRQSPANGPVLFHQFLRV
jgi:hypothetical protein